MQIDDLENDSPKTICAHVPLGGDICTHPSWMTTDPHQESGKHYILGPGDRYRAMRRSVTGPQSNHSRMDLEELQLEGLQETDGTDRYT